MNNISYTQEEYDVILRKMAREYMRDRFVKRLQFMSDEDFDTIIEQRKDLKQGKLIPEEEVKQILKNTEGE